MLKLTFLKYWQMGGIALLCMVFTGMSWPWAIEQSSSQVEAWLGNQRLMLDTSVVLTIEVVCQLSYSILAARFLDKNEKIGIRTLSLYRLLRIFPGILILPVLFATEVSAIYAFTGVGFAVIAWSVAAIIFLLLSGGSMITRWLVPEKDLRLEIFFLVNVLIMVLGIVCTVNGTTQFKGTDDIEWLALAASMGLLLLCASIGYITNKIKSTKIINN
ncbi:MAG: hypothetical protein ACI3ZD_10535 [Prevotella sp.]